MANIVQRKGCRDVLYQLLLLAVVGLAPLEEHVRLIKQICALMHELCQQLRLLLVAACVALFLFVECPQETLSM